MELNVKIIAFYIAALFIHLSSNAQRYAYEIGKPDFTNDIPTAMFYFNTNYTKDLYCPDVIDYYGDSTVEWNISFPRLLDATIEPVEQKDFELLVKHSTLLTSVLRKYVSAEDYQFCTYENVKSFIEGEYNMLSDTNIDEGYYGAFYASRVAGSYDGSDGRTSLSFYEDCNDTTEWWCNSFFDRYFEGEIFNLKKSIRSTIAQNKAFRNAIYDRVLDFLTDVVSALPQNVKNYIIDYLLEIDNILDEIGRHDYSLRTYPNSERWYYFIVDGKANHEIGYTKTGWILRRIYIDKIPYNELKETTTNIISKLKGIDVGKNPNFTTGCIIDNTFLFFYGPSQSDACLYNIRKRKMYDFHFVRWWLYCSHMKVEYNQKNEKIYTIRNISDSNGLIKEVKLDADGNIILIKYSNETN